MMENHDILERSTDLLITKLISDAMEVYKKGDYETFNEYVYHLESYTGMSREKLASILKGENHED